jgi:hypothetical protein
VVLLGFLCTQKALRKAHIYPRNGRRYEAGHIVAAIDHAFGSLPHLVCKNGSVQELRLCFHKDYQVPATMYTSSVVQQQLKEFLPWL